MKRLFFLCTIALFTLTNSYSQTEKETVQWLNTKVPPLMLFSEYEKGIKFTGSSLFIPYGFVNDLITKGTYVDSWEIIGVVTTFGSKSIHIALSGKFEYCDDYAYQPQRTTPSEKCIIYLRPDVSESTVNQIVKAIKHLATLNGAKITIDDDIFK